MTFVYLWQKNFKHKVLMRDSLRVSSIIPFTFFVFIRKLEIYNHLLKDYCNLDLIIRELSCVDFYRNYQKQSISEDRLIGGKLLLFFYAFLLVLLYQ